MDSISLQGLEVDCIVGVYPSERQTPQPVHLDITLYLDTRRAGTASRLRHTVDYARLCGELRFLLQASKYTLIESAAEAIARYLLAPPRPVLRRSPVDRVRVTIAKPRASLFGATPRVSVERTAQDFEPMEIEVRPFGEVDVVYDARDCGIYRLRIAPGCAIPTHVHRLMEESEMILTPGLLLQGKPVALGSARTWPFDVPHRYDNPTSEEQVILCVDRPAFVPSDEIEVDDPPVPLDQIPFETYYDPKTIDAILPENR